jgi:hypothetical protein
MCERCFSRFTTGLNCNMATRLPVLIAQHTRTSGQESKIEERLIEPLLMAKGIDLSMVQALESIQPGGTDQLCLQGILGSCAMVSWLAPQEVARHLDRLAIPGELFSRLPDHPPVPLVRDGQVPMLNRRRIHLFSLLDWSPEPLVEELRSLCTSWNTAVVSLPIRPPAGNILKEVRMSASGAPETKPSPQVASSPLPLADARGSDDLTDEDEAALDRLLDQLDDSGI